MPFVPPLFKNFGKKFTDLVEKDFKLDDKTKNADFNNKVVVTSKRGDDLTLKSEASVVKGAVDGKFNLGYTFKYGDVSFESASNGNLKLEAKLKDDKLAKGVVVTSSAEKKDSLVCKGGVEYAQEFFAGKAEYEHNPAKDNLKSLTVSAAVGFDGLSVGGEFKKVLSQDEKGKESDLALAGLNYNDGDITGSLKMNKDEGLDVAYHQTVNKTWSQGAGFSTKNKGSASQTLFLAGSYVFDSNTAGKAVVTVPRGDASAYTVTTLLSYKLANPAANLGFKYHFVPKDNSKSLFGVEIALGN